MSRSEYLVRRLAALEAKVTPTMHPWKAQAIKNPEFARVVTNLGVDFEKIKDLPGLFDGFPRETLRLIVERLKELIAAR